MARTSVDADGPRLSSPWPVFVALGIALSELGVLLGGPMIPVAVGGIALLEGSLVGILREAGYARTRWRTALVVGAAFIGIGLLLVALTHVAVRGTAIAVAGGVAVVAAPVLWLVDS